MVKSQTRNRSYNMNILIQFLILSYIYIYRTVYSLNLYFQVIWIIRIDQKILSAILYAIFNMQLFVNFTHYKDPKRKTAGLTCIIYIFFHTSLCRNTSRALRMKAPWLSDFQWRAVASCLTNVAQSTVA